MRHAQRHDGQRRGQLGLNLGPGQLGIDPGPIRGYSEGNVGPTWCHVGVYLSESICIQHIFHLGKKHPNSVQIYISGFEVGECQHRQTDRDWNTPSLPPPPTKETLRPTPGLIFETPVDTRNTTIRPAFGIRRVRSCMIYFVCGTRAHTRRS